MGRKTRKSFGVILFGLFFNLLGSNGQLFSTVGTETGPEEYTVYSSDGSPVQFDNAVSAASPSEQIPQQQQHMPQIELRSVLFPQSQVQLQMPRFPQFEPQLQMQNQIPPQDMIMDRSFDESPIYNQQLNAFPGQENIFMSPQYQNQLYNLGGQSSNSIPKFMGSFSPSHIQDLYSQPSSPMLQTVEPSSGNIPAGFSLASLYKNPQTVTTSETQTASSPSLFSSLFSQIMPKSESASTNNEELVASDSSPFHSHHHHHGHSSIVHHPPTTTVYHDHGPAPFILPNGVEFGKHVKDITNKFQWPFKWPSPYAHGDAHLHFFSGVGKALDNTFGGAWAARRALKKGVGHVLSSKVRLGGTIAYVGSEVLAKAIDVAATI